MALDPELEHEAKQIEDSVRVELDRTPVQRVAIDIQVVTLLKVLAVLFAVYLVTRIWSLILLVGISVMLSAALSPYLAWLERRRLRRGYALTLVILSLLLTLAALVALIVPGLVTQTRELLHQSNHYVAELQALLSRHGLHLQLRKSLKSLPHLIEGQDKLFIDVARTIVTSVIALVTIVVLTLYLLVDQERIKSFFVGMFPSERRAGVLGILAELRRQVGGYVRGQLITSGLATLFAGLIMFLAGVPHYLTLAVFVGLADFIPMFGGLIGTVPAALIALTISPIRAVVVVVGFIAYQQLENHIIVPRVYANTLRVSPLVALVGLLLGAKLLGILGMLVALPLVAALPVILDFGGVKLPTIGTPRSASPDAADDI
ncbi:MAG TPA: AI-2E family transporter [Chloroflexota bacterium]|nr:AI-2E family transporter [Chloroflexota bacterium]